LVFKAVKYQWYYQHYTALRWHTSFFPEKRSSLSTAITDSTHELEVSKDVCYMRNWLNSISKYTEEKFPFDTWWNRMAPPKVTARTTRGSYMTRLTSLILRCYDQQAQCTHQQVLQQETTYLSSPFDTFWEYLENKWLIYTNKENGWCVLSKCSKKYSQVGAKPVQAYLNNWLLSHDNRNPANIRKKAIHSIKGKVKYHF
jgi:hypothetical protein